MRRWVHGSAGLGLVAVSLATSALWLRLGLPRPACAFRAWTGLPCATCGSTRLVRELLSGHVAEAAAFNPLVFSAIVLATVWSSLSIARAVLDAPARPFVPALVTRAHLVVAGAMAILANWIYLVLRGV